MEQLRYEIGGCAGSSVRCGEDRGQRPGFTLIELLVVVAIISLLISILTPSLSRARQQAKSTICLTRLSEFGKALNMYENDEHTLPPMRYRVRREGPGETEVFHGWAEILYVMLYRDRDFDMAQDFPVQRNLGGNYQLFLCKEGQPAANSSGHYRVYDVAWSIGGLDRVKPKLPLIVDANPLVTDPEDLKRSDIPRLHIAGLEGEAFIDERHYGGANFLFPDGHAERNTRLKEKLAEDWDLDPGTPNR